MRFARSLCIGTAVINEALVAGAYSGRGARTIVAIEFADRFAVVFRIGGESVAILATAALGCHADSHLAGLGANRLAEARVDRLVIDVACANLWRRARAGNATLAAIGQAGEIRVELVMLVTFRALAYVRRYTVTVCARTFADRLAHVVAGFSVT